jgi:methyltransferase (TIGR00027 family)
MLRSACGVLNRFGPSAILPKFLSFAKKNERSFFIGGSGPPVERSQASQTAQSMAMFRALESARPERSRLFWDAFAVHFLNRTMRVAVRAAEKSPAVQALLTRYIDKRWPGARPSGVARTVFIDRALGEALRSGIAQVVILGAGYDSRAYRIDEMNRTLVFEVDSGETQRVKRERVWHFSGLSLQSVKFVAADFLRQTVSEALASAGFDSLRETFFIWEGVIHYLAAEAVDSTLRFVGGCAKGSGIAFTYIHRGLLDGSGAFSMSANVVRLLEKAGERWKFGFYPDELSPYLRNCGMKLVEDLGAIEYGARFSGARREQMKGYEFYHVAIAKVGTAGGVKCRK